MQNLQDILYKVPIVSLSGIPDIVVKDLQTDSRKVSEGSCFIAVRGLNADGHMFIEKSISNGARVIVCEILPVEIIGHVSYVLVTNTAVVAGIMAHNFYGQVSEKLQLVGVTGTNGKTTVATLLFKLFRQLGFTCGLISTVQNQVQDEIIPSTHTTPDAVSLNELLSKMEAAGCTHVFMEVSSHALHQDRVAGLHFAGGIFTNITHDHLDYHGNFDEYIRAKKKFFDGLSSKAFAITNADDKRGLVMLQNTAAIKHAYSLKTMAEYKGRIVENGIGGLVMMVNEQEVHLRLIGTFNAYNVLAVFGAARCLNQDRIKVLQVLSNLDGAEGRFDHMVSPADKVIGIIDYAHTPDALLNVLATIKNLKQANEKIITVVGCGGDRDKTKRPIMAEVACQHSDRVIFTSDNPRSEDPLIIIKEMEDGVNIAQRRKYISIADRREAIKTAVSLAGKEDIILIAGKGHEKYQEINGVKNDFDDRKILLETFELLGK